MSDRLKQAVVFLSISVVILAIGLVIVSLPIEPGHEATQRRGAWIAGGVGIISMCVLNALRLALFSPKPPTVIVMPISPTGESRPK